MRQKSINAALRAAIECTWPSPKRRLDQTADQETNFYKGLLFAREVRAGERSSLPLPLAPNPCVELFRHPSSRSRRASRQSLLARRRFDLGIANATRPSLGITTAKEFRRSNPGETAPCRDFLSPAVQPNSSSQHPRAARKSEPRTRSIHQE